jgi:hypothetical protein
LQSHYGGGIYTYSWNNTAYRNRKPTFLWHIASNRVRYIIDEAYPYLIIKKPQADLIRSLPKREIYRDVGNGRIRVQMTAEDFAENERLVASMKILNKRGL